MTAVHPIQLERAFAQETMTHAGTNQAEQACKQEQCPLRDPVKKEPLLGASTLKKSSPLGQLLIIDFGHKMASCKRDLTRQHDMYIRE